MGDIYRRADVVFSWLGDPGNVHAESIRRIKALASLRGQPHRDCDLRDKNLVNMDDIRNIASNAYWSRHWIKQEVLLAKHVRVFSGNHVFDLDDLREAALLAGIKARSNRINPLKRAKQLSQFRPMSCTSEAMEALLDLRAEKATSFSLPELVARFQGSQCEDPEDRLYAILSLTDEDSRRCMNIDYEKSCFQLLLETYSHWTGSDEVSAGQIPTCELSTSRLRIAKMLSLEELMVLRVSRKERMQVHSQAWFRTTRLVTISSCTVLACIADPALSQAARVLDLVSETPPDMVIESCAVRQTHLVYAASIPQAGDMLGCLDQRVFFFRRCGGGSSGEQLELMRAPLTLGLLGTGKEVYRVRSDDPVIESCPSHRFLVDPLLWHGEQLPDASCRLATDNGQVLYGSERTSGVQLRGVKILCNPPAMIQRLLDSIENTRCEDATQPATTSGAEGLGEV